MINLIADYAVARTYHSHMLAKQAIPNQDPIILAPAFILAYISP